MHSCAVSSPVGPLTLRADEGALTGISFSGDSQVIARLSDIGRAPDPLREAARQLEAYFAGKLSRFDLPLAPAGTPFQRDVWNVLRSIPYGETTSYGEIARLLGKAQAYRAVGAANGSNPIPIVIPCHRVIGSDGSLTGFGGGLGTKRHLLQLEIRHRHALEPDMPRNAWKKTVGASLSAR
jgi:methylated-DNA-[protein]-cysteine S-methyltransferase